MKKTLVVVAGLLMGGVTACAVVAKLTHDASGLYLASQCADPCAVGQEVCRQFGATSCPGACAMGQQLCAVPLVMPSDFSRDGGSWAADTK